MKNYVPYILILLFFSTGIFFRCANPASPTGGPKDTIPPKIISMIPNNFSTNFKSEKVIIEFDEYVQLKDIQKEIIIAPPISKRPGFKVKGRSVEITFESKLDSVTTYKIDFGSSIQDNNENNPLRNFSYIFSTGKHIDSLVMTGQLIDAEKGDTIINGLVYLYSEDNDSLTVDSTIFIGKPLSVARTDSNGVFIATNLKNMNYLVYGIGDKNNNSYYDVGEDIVAFSDSLHNPKNMPPFKVWYNKDRQTIEATPQFKFYAFSEKMKRKQNLLEMKRTERGMLQFFFAADSALVDSLIIENVNSSDIFTEFTPKRDTLTAWIMLPDSVLADSLKGSISYHMLSSIGEDSIATKKINLFNKSEKKNKRDENNEPKIEKFKLSIDNSAKKDIYKDINLTFQKPVKNINKDLIIFEKAVKEEAVRGVRRDASQEETRVEDLKREKVDFELIQDSTTSLRWTFKTDWEPATTYFLTSNTGAFVNIKNAVNDSLFTKIDVLDPEECSVLIFDVINNDSTINYVLEVLDSKSQNVVYKSQIEKAGELKMDYIIPGTYRIRLIKDVNKNGKWDSGELLMKKSPEKVVIYTDDQGNSFFETKANWEQYLTIDISKFFK